MFVVLSCLCASLWVIYITFYHSRVMGYILTRLINFKYINNGQYFKIGEFIRQSYVSIIFYLSVLCLKRTIQLVNTNQRYREF